MAIASKIKKIFRMSPGEISYRIHEQFRIRAEKKNAENERQKIYDPDFNFFEDERHFRLYKTGDVYELLSQKGFCRRLAPALLPDDAAAFKKEYPDSYKKSIQRADDLIENRLSFLGVSFTLPNPIPWQSDPVSLAPFPKGFFRNIDIFTNSNPGDIKHVWEVNRLQYLIELAKAAFISGEEKYKKHFEELLLDWTDKNPYKHGVAWASALEVGVRAVAFLWAFHFYRSISKPDSRVLKTLIFQLYLCTRYLNENLSIYFSPYNHLIGEAAGLFLAAYIFPGFKDAPRNAAKAWAILEDQAKKQFHGDGGCVEQATFYHHFTLGFYLQSIITRGLNGDNVSNAVRKRVESALMFAGYMTKPDGLLPYLGDIDNARSIYFSDPTNWDFSAFQALGAVLFNNPQMKHIAGQNEKEELLWMLTEDQRKSYGQLKAVEPEQKSINLPESGYSIFRTGFSPEDSYIHIDCGPIAHGVYHDETPSAAHGHADELAIELAAFGESFLIDPGFANYRGDFERHSYFRSTAAHNTIEINNKSQAKQGGILVWSRAPRFRRLKYFDGDSLRGFVGEHYGYVAETGKPVHRRFAAFVDNSFFLVWDHIKGEKDDAVELSINWHFSDTVSLTRQKDGWLAAGKNAQLGLFQVSNRGEKLKTNTYKGGDSISQGWISPLYRDVKPAPLLNQKINTKIPFETCTILIPAQNESQLKIENNKSGLQFELNDDIYQVKDHGTSIEILKNDTPSYYLNNIVDGDGRVDWFEEKK